MKDKDKTPFEPENFEQLYFHLFNRVTDMIYYMQEIQVELEEMYIRMRKKEETRPLGTLLEWPLKSQAHTPSGVASAGEPDLLEMESKESGPLERESNDSDPKPS